MKLSLKLTVWGLSILLNSFTMAQNTRITDRNQIGWYNAFGTFKLNNKWSLHGEYQWRRDNFITDWQQSLLRVGVNYQVHPNVQLRVGYAWIETFAYGDIPINSLGRDFTEHRLFQMANITHRVGKIDLSHRYMLEQRWMGRYSSPDVVREDSYALWHRARYMLRAQMPLKGNTIADKTFYVAAYDELFVGFGRNVNENIFDQNRFGLMLGYRFSPTLRLEGGYFSQIVQLGREVEGRNVFQYNNGLIVNAWFNIDWSKKK